MFLVSLHTIYRRAAGSLVAYRSGYRRISPMNVRVLAHHADNICILAAKRSERFSSYCSAFYLSCLVYLGNTTLWQMLMRMVRSYLNTVDVGVAWGITSLHEIPLLSATRNFHWPLSDVVGHPALAKGGCLYRPFRPSILEIHMHGTLVQRQITTTVRFFPIGPLD